MKTSLRIGNTIQEGTIKSFYEYGVHIGYGKCYNYSELNPILIESINLSKFGFVNGTLMVPNSNISLMYMDGMIEMACRCDETSISIPILHSTGVSCEFLHELQNLYHALTGNELSEKVNSEGGNNEIY